VIFDLICLLFCIVNIVVAAATRNWPALVGWFVAGVGALRCWANVYGVDDDDIDSYLE